MHLGALLPRINLHQTTGVFEHPVRIVLSFGVVGQPAQHVQRLTAQGFLLHQLPFVKGQTVAQGKAGQQIAAIQVGGLTQPTETDRATIAALSCLC